MTSDRPIGTERLPVYARYLTRLDELLTSEPDDLHEQVRSWWSDIHSELYPDDPVSEAIGLLSIDHRIFGFPKGVPHYECAEVFLALFEAFFHADDRAAADRFLDAAFAVLSDVSRRSVRRRVNEAEERFLGMATPGTNPLVQTKEGRIRSGHRKVLESLPSPKVSVIVAKCGISERRVKAHLSDLRDAGWVDSADGVHRCTAAGERALASERQ